MTGLQAVGLLVTAWLVLGLVTGPLVGRRLARRRRDLFAPDERLADRYGEVGSKSWR